MRKNMRHLFGIIVPLTIVLSMISSFFKFFCCSGCSFFPWEFQNANRVTHQNQSSSNGDESYNKTSIPSFYDHKSFSVSFSNVSLNLSRCSKCRFDPTRIRPNSNRFDLVLSSCFGNTQNAIVFVRSLRTTGCLASIIILTDDETYSHFSYSEFEALFNCGCYVISIGVKPVMTWGSFIKWRLEAYYSFLLPRITQVKRIIISDINDIVFQGDPFDEEFSGNSIIFGIEPGSISLYPERVKAINQLNSSFSIYISNRHPIDSSIFGGVSVGVLHFLHSVISIINITNKSIGFIGDESIYFSIAVYSNSLAKKSIRIIVDSRGKFFTRIPTEKGDYIDKIGKYFNSMAGRPPLVLTKYSGNFGFCRSVYMACPRSNLVSKRYLSCGSERDYRIWQKELT